MKTTLNTTPLTLSDLARARLLSTKGDPFMVADWQNVVFLHFLAAPELLRPVIPSPFELELHQGAACVSLVALTMRRFRAFQRGSVAAWLFRPIPRQCFLNLRTYVKGSGEPGALFLWGWLSKPFGVGLPLGRFGLPCAFGSLDYTHSYEKGILHGTVNETVGGPAFSYRAAIEPGTAFRRAPLDTATGARTFLSAASSQPSTILVVPRALSQSNAAADRNVRAPAPVAVSRCADFRLCPPGSLSEFAMERYTGFFCRGKQPLIFRAWHPPWLQTSIDPAIVDDPLLTAKFPWFKQARLAAANFAPGFERVWLGRAHRLEKIPARRPAHRSVLSAFYEMP